jgi:hypothetical protein
MIRRLAPLVALAAAAALLPAVAGATPQPLVTMRQVQGQTWQTVTVRADGHGAVGMFIGEVTGVKYAPFTLSRPALAQLRREIAAARSLPHSVYLTPSTSAEPFVRDEQYILALGPRSLVTDKTDTPARMRPLVKDLLALIVQGLPNLSDHRDASTQHLKGE